jgi:hypothetical protein
VQCTNGRFQEVNIFSYWSVSGCRRPNIWRIVHFAPVDSQIPAQCGLLVGLRFCCLGAPVALLWLLSPLVNSTAQTLYETAQSTRSTYSCDFKSPHLCISNVRALRYLCLGDCSWLRPTLAALIIVPPERECSGSTEATPRREPLTKDNTAHSAQPSLQGQCRKLYSTSAVSTKAPARTAVPPAEAYSSDFCLRFNCL